MLHSSPIDRNQARAYIERLSEARALSLPIWRLARSKGTVLTMTLQPREVAVSIIRGFFSGDLAAT